MTQAAANLTDDLEVLTFDLCGETFALDATLVREVLDRAPETFVPGAPRLVDSVINFRGKIIPLADLRVAFALNALPASIDSRVIVIEFELDGEPTLIGLRADKVFEVAMIEKASTEAAPKLGTRWRQDYIRCLAKKRGDIIVIPDLEVIFSQGAASGNSNVFSLSAP
jgi:purine-binding chemotaxis protein CheW